MYALFSSNYYVRIELLDKKSPSMQLERKKNLVNLQRDMYSSTAVGFFFMERWNFTRETI